MKSDQINGFLDRAGHLPVSACDKARGLARVVVGVELRLDWSDRASRRVELLVEVLGRSMIVGADLSLPILRGLGEGGRFGLRLFRPRRESPHAAEGAVSKRAGCTFGKVDRRGVSREIGGDSLSVPRASTPEGSLEPSSEC